MVLAFKIGDFEVHEPPYTWEEEMEAYRRMAGGRNPTQRTHGEIDFDRRPLNSIPTEIASLNRLRSTLHTSIHTDIDFLAEQSRRFPGSGFEVCSFCPDPEVF